MMDRTGNRRSAVIVAGLLIAIGCVLSHVRGHEVKVLLDRMSVEKGAEDVVYLSWGHLLPTDGPTRGEDIERYQLVTPGGSIKFLALDTESDQRNVVHLEEDGVFTAEAVRKPAILTIFTRGDRHVHFVGPKTEIRDGSRIEDSFRSFQYAKALVTAGSGGVAPKPVGHVLEIVPEAGSASWVVGKDIAFQVLFEGKPISGKLFQAKRIDFKPDDVWTWTRPTDEKGKAVLRVDQPGTWLLKATVEKPAPPGERERFDADHWTATLILEIKPGE